MVTRSESPIRVVVPVRDGQPAVGATETVAEALDAASATAPVAVILIGHGATGAAAVLGDAGFATLAMTVIDKEAFAPAAWTATLVPLLDDADLVVLPASADGRDLAPRLAVSLGRPLVAGAVAVDTTGAVVPRASGRALAEVALVGPVVATLQPGVRGGAAALRGDEIAPRVVEVDGAPDARDAQVLEVLGPDAATMDLAEAPFILGAGAGLGTDDAIDDLATVADALDASLGATRVVTDEGWIPHERQIGTTGVVVDPRVYVAFGVSGAVQHTSGLGDPEVMISVNTDAHCPMMEMADLAIVADAPAVVAELRRRLADGARTAEEA